PAPTVVSINPSTGPTSGNTLVTIHGTNFQSGASVTIGGLPAMNVTVVDPTTIIALTPLGPANEQVSVKKDVVVTNPNNAPAAVVVNVGGTAVTARGAFAYLIAPPRKRSAKH